MSCTYETPEEARAKLRDDLDRRTDMLCRLCGLLDKNGIGLPTDIWSWWQAHKVADAAREKRERENEQRMMFERDDEAKKAARFEQWKKRK